MASKTTDTANKTLDKWFGAADFTPPATWYAALLDSSGTELPGNGYARVALTNNSTNFPNASSKSKTVAVDVTFPTATADWSSFAKIAFYTASTGGTQRFVDVVRDNSNNPTSVTVLNGQQYSIPSGNLVLSES